MRAKTTAQAILDSHAQAKDRRSAGIGCSVIGEECERKMWYDFRWVSPPEKFDGRMRRLFETGKLEEERIILELHGIGCEVQGADPDTGAQWRVEELGGHVSGYLDGIVKNIPEEPLNYYGFEAKTHSTKSFDKLREKGVEKGHPKHFAQCQMVAKLKELPGTLYVAVCKETDEVYSELVPLNHKKADALLDKAERVVRATEPPERLKNANPEYPPCSWCLHKNRCHYATEYRFDTPVKSCRTCVHAEPQPDGVWGCNLKDIVLDKDRQAKGCDDGHLFIESLLPFGPAIHVDPSWGFQLFAGMQVNKAGSGTVETDKGEG